MEENNNENSKSQSPDINIEQILNDYDLNASKSKFNGSKWKINKTSDYYDKGFGELDIDKYWNFPGTVSPRIEVEFLTNIHKEEDKKTKEIKFIPEWTNVNKVTENIYSSENKFSTSNNNNYIVSANISDNGPKELELVLYDRNFTDLRQLIGRSINIVNTFNSKSDDDNKIKKSPMEVVNGTDINFFTIPNKIEANLRIRYGYNDNKNTIVGENYSGVLSGGLNDKRYRWRTSETDKGYNDNGEYIGTDKTLVGSFQQCTLLSSWEEFFIVGMTSTLTNTGIRYNIKGISSESFDLNGYKMYQQYSKIVGKPKTVLATLMHLFNENENSPIKLIWSDDKVNAKSSTINGQEMLIDYKTGTYISVEEDTKDTYSKNVSDAIKNINEYLSMLNNLKACFKNYSNNTLSSYCKGEELGYSSNIDEVEKLNLRKFAKKPKKSSFLDLVMWPFASGYSSFDEDKKLNNIDNYSSNLYTISKFQYILSEDYEMLNNLNIDKINNIFFEGKSEVSIRDMMKIWIGEIATNAYENIELSIPEDIKDAIELEKKYGNYFNKINEQDLIIRDVIKSYNNILPLKWKINYPENTNILNSKNINNYYISSSSNIVEANCILKYESDNKKEIKYNEINETYINLAFQNEKDNLSLEKIYNWPLNDKENDKKNISSFINLLREIYIKDTQIFKEDFDPINILLDTYRPFDENKTINLDGSCDFFENQTSKENKDSLKYLRTKTYLPDEVKGDDFSNCLGKLLSKINNLISNLNSLLNISEFKHIDFISEEGGLTNIFYKDKMNKIYLNFKIEDLDNLSNYEIYHESKENIKIFIYVNNKSCHFYFDINKNKIVISENETEKQKAINNIKEILRDTIKDILQFTMDTYNKEEEILGISIPRNFEVKNIKINYMNYLNNLRSFLLNKKNNLKAEINNKEEAQKEFKGKTNKLINSDLKTFLDNVLKEINSNETPKIKKFKIGEDENEIEEFGKIDGGENLFKRAEKLIFKADDILEKDVDSLDNDINKKMNSLLEILKKLEGRQKKIDESNIGKEIELSLGCQESKNSKKEMTKTVASLLNDFCSQCQPKINILEEELIKDGENNNNIMTIKDETGQDIPVNIYKDLPRYNLTWGVIGKYIKNDSSEIPVVGIYYKEPKKIGTIRRYNWGVGNKDFHCIKDLSITTGSEFALMNSYNTITKTGAGNLMTTVKNDFKGEAENATLGNLCFFNEIFENEKEKNMFNNLLNGISKGTITLLGDPTLKFQGIVQPYTFPIKVNIKIPKRSAWSNKIDNEKRSVDLPEVSELSGYYVITKITHNISKSGYTTTLDVMKYPGTKDLYSYNVVANEEKKNRI